MNKEVISLFPTPVGIYQIDIDLGLVYKNLSKFKTGPHGLLEDSNSSYDQDSSVLYDEDFKDLHMKIQTCLDDYVSIVQLQPLVVTGSWYNEMNVGCKVNLHRHEGSVVSGAFYVNTKDAVPLRFKNPLLPYKMNDLHEGMSCQFSSPGVQLPPESGNLVLFPSWLEHETDAEVGTRCVISFNTLYKRMFFSDS
jgi:uncharacterized protein (TIGR02466 family)